MNASSPHELRAALASYSLAAADALPSLATSARSAPLRSIRIESYRVLGDIAGRAFDARADTAEDAAWVLLEIARHTGSAFERGALLAAMGRGFRNAWLMPFVHSRLHDEDPEVAAAAIGAAGGLGIAGLVEAVAAFLAEETPAALRRAAIGALGRMASVSAAPRLLPFLQAGPEDAAAALAALTEIRTPLAVDAALGLLESEPEDRLAVAAARYLAELGRAEVLPHLRRMARAGEAETRIAAGLAARALKAECSQDVGERILIALSERDPAVRAALARRLRTLPVGEVLAQAEVLLAEDAEGVVQVLGELRGPEVTAFLLEVATRSSAPLGVRALAVGSIEASEASQREALAAITRGTLPPEIRAAAVRAIGAFASIDEMLAHAGPLASDPAPELRGAFLWALQLAVRPERLSAEQRMRCEAEMRRALADPDPWVRRRAAFVAGNLRLRSLAPDLTGLIVCEKARAEIRVAAFVGLGELAAPAAIPEIVALLGHEGDAEALAAGSRALARTAHAHPGRALDLSGLHAKVASLLHSRDPVEREAAARLAGLARDETAAVAPLARDEAPRVREEALVALGRMSAAASEEPLVAALDDADPGLRECAAGSLVARGSRRALEAVLGFVAGEGDPRARAAIAARLEIPETEAGHVLGLIDAALVRLGGEDAAYEPLLAQKLRLLERHAAASPVATADIEASIVAVFPGYPRLLGARGFEQLGRSLRTAESLFGMSTGMSSGTSTGIATGIADADLSPAIVLWMKCMEGYVHGWLAGRLQVMQRDPRTLFEHVDRLMVQSWPTYQGYVSERWKDLVDMGQARVEIPLRSVANTLREFQEHRPKRLDTPLSVTEWARMIVFFGVDHPTGVRNLFRVASSNPDQVLRLAHRLHTLAAVRNMVTHRDAAGVLTLHAFRKAYYAAFEELTRLA